MDIAIGHKLARTVVTCGIPMGPWGLDAQLAEIVDTTGGPRIFVVLWQHGGSQVAKRRGKPEIDQVRGLLYPQFLGRRVCEVILLSLNKIEWAGGPFHTASPKGRRSSASGCR